ncbi:uncharacterized [Tachysurus ichikawai]
MVVFLSELHLATSPSKNYRLPHSFNYSLVQIPYANTECQLGVKRHVKVKIRQHYTWKSQGPAGEMEHHQSLFVEFTLNAAFRLGEKFRSCSDPNQPEQKNRTGEAIDL